MTKPEESRFVQIAACTANDMSVCAVFALDAEGRVWEYNHKEKNWDRYPNTRDLSHD